MAKVLAKAHYTDLKETLGLSFSTSLKILHIPDRDKMESIDAYEKVLDKEEFVEVKQKLSKIDDRSLASILDTDKASRVGASHRQP